MNHPIDVLSEFLISIQGPLQKRACIGFDAVVDLLTQPICTKNDDRAEHFTTISQFGEFLTTRKGSSCLVNVSTILEKPGGNMVNLSTALGHLLVPVDAVGSFGLPHPLPDFNNLSEHVTLHSVAHSGRCFALEFADGKVMLAQMDKVDELDFQSLMQRMSRDKLRTLFGEANLVGLVNWNEVRASTEIWSGLIREVFEWSGPDKSKIVIFDFTDCSGHTDDRILEALDLLPSFTQHRFTVMSFNQNEACHFADLLSIAPQKDNAVLADALRLKIGCDLVVIHPNNCAVAAGKDGTVSCPGFFIDKPLISTGGGDNFNAGLSMGLLCGLELQQALLLGNAVSGYYVRVGRSPSRIELAQFLQGQKEHWEEGTI